MLPMITVYNLTPPINDELFYFEAEDNTTNYENDYEITLNAITGASSYTLEKSINGGTNWSSVTLTNRQASITVKYAEHTRLRHYYTKNGRDSVIKEFRIGSLVNNGFFDGDATGWTGGTYDATKNRFLGGAYKTSAGSAPTLTSNNDMDAELKTYILGASKLIETNVANTSALKFRSDNGITSPAQVNLTTGGADVWGNHLNEVTVVDNETQDWRVTVGVNAQNPSSVDIWIDAVFVYEKFDYVPIWEVVSGHGTATIVKGPLETTITVLSVVYDAGLTADVLRIGLANTALIASGTLTADIKVTATNTILAHAANIVTSGGASTTATSDTIGTTFTAFSEINPAGIGGYSHVSVVFEDATVGDVYVIKNETYS